MCRRQNHLQGHFDRQRIPGFMVKHFSVSRALSPYWKLRRKGLGQDRTRSQPEVWTKNADLDWRSGLVRDFMNCTSLFSSLGGSSSPLWGLAARSSQISQGCVLPATSSLLPTFLSLSRVSGSPSKGASEVKLEKTWSLPQGFYHWHKKLL